MTSNPPTTQPNSRWIWPFEILEQIGEGGMGVVYRARYVVNGRLVALKMLPNDIADKTALARFEREVEVLKTLKHPNIVRSFGGVCEDKRRFYAMELLEGGSLEDQLIAKGKLPWELVIQYGLQMCAALDYSHEKGVVHRDVKPSNFLISPSGQLKLSDFGLASVSAHRKITAAGKTAGTFLYMAPEQIRGHEVTPRTDLYALGCVLYELVTGQVPFLGETPGATLHLHCHATPVRPTEKALDCPLALEKIILKLLEKDAENRYQTAAEVARDLRAVSQTVTITVRRRPGEIGSDHLDAPTRESIEAQKQTLPVSAQQARVPWNTMMIIGALLFLSCAWNGYQWSRLHALSRSSQLWEEALHSEIPDVRTQAAYSIGELAKDDRRMLKVLREELESDQPAQRIAALSGLARAGQSASSLLPAMIKIQKEDANQEVRDAAAGAIQVIRSSDKVGSFPWFKLISGGTVLLIVGWALLKWRDELTEWLKTWIDRVG